MSNQTDPVCRGCRAPLIRSGLSCTWQCRECLEKYFSCYQHEHCAGELVLDDVFSEEGIECFGCERWLCADCFQNSGEFDRESEQFTCEMCLASLALIEGKQ